MFIKSPLARHLPFYIAAAIGIGAFLVAFTFSARLSYTIAANAFFIVYLALALAQMPLLTADFLRRNAEKTDIPVPIIFLITTVIIGIAVAALFQLVNATGAPGLPALLFAMVSIPLGWLTIHTMAALHYAHLYWFAGDAPQGEPAKARTPHGGLDFPGGKPPQGWDFLYFSTVIGMTAQTADTGITTVRMRRAVLLHSIVSFFFNTVIVASAVNIAVSVK